MSAFKKTKWSSGKMMEKKDLSATCHTDAHIESKTLQEGQITSTASQPFPEMRMVLLGRKDNGKTRVANLIMGKKQSAGSQPTENCVIHRTEVAARQLTVVDTPGWEWYYSHNGTPKWVRQETAYSVALCPPGPHVLLLVVRACASVTKSYLQETWELLEILGSEVWNHIMVLFTSQNKMDAAALQQKIQEGDSGLQELLKKCWNRYHILSPDHSCLTQLLQRVEEMMLRNKGSYFMMDDTHRMLVNEMRLKTWRKRQRWSEQKMQTETLKSLFTGQKHLSAEVGDVRLTLMPSHCHRPELRMVLLGEREAGKSSAGNTILRRAHAFDTRHVTEDSTSQYSQVAQWSITVVDTPGWEQGSLVNTPIRVQNEIKASIWLCPPGPHILLLIVAIHGDVHQQSAKKQLEILGDEVWKYSIILFTNGDKLREGVTIEQYIMSSNHTYELVKHCGNRYHVFNNVQMDNETQVIELLTKIEKLVAGNGGKTYAPWMQDLSKLITLKQRKTESMQSLCEENKNNEENKRSQEEQDLVISMLTDKVNDQQINIESMGIIIQENAGIMQSHEEQLKKMKEELTLVNEENEKYRDDETEMKERYKHMAKEMVETKQLCDDRLKEQEAEKVFILEDREHIIKNLKKKNGETKKVLAEMKIKYDEAEHKLDEMRKVSEKTENILNDSTREMEEQKRMRERVEREIQEIIRNHEAQMAKKDEDQEFIIKMLREKIDAQQKDIEVMGNIINEKDRKITDILQSNKQMLQMMVDKITLLNGEIEEYRENKKEITEKYKHMEKEVFESRKMYKDLQIQKEACQVFILEDKDCIIKNLKEKNGETEKALDDMKINYDKLETKLDEMRKVSEKTENILNDSTREMEEQKRMRERAQREIQEIIRNHEAQMVQKDEENRKKHEDQESIIKMLKDKVDVQQSDIEAMEIVIKQNAGIMQSHEEQLKKMKEELTLVNEENEKYRDDETERYKHMAKEMVETNKLYEDLNMEKKAFKDTDCYIRKGCYNQTIQFEKMYEKGKSKLKKGSNSVFKDNHIKREPQDLAYINNAICNQWRLHTVTSEISLLGAHQVVSSSFTMPSELRLVMLGESWANTSSVGGAILDRKETDTMKCLLRQGHIAEMQVKVVETLGMKWHLGPNPTHELQQQALHTMSLCSPGPHAFLLVIPIYLIFTPLYKKAVMHYMSLLGEDVWRHTMVLFTWDEALEETIQQHIAQQRTLQWLLKKCGNRYHVLGSTHKGDQSLELMNKVKRMVVENKGHYCSQQNSLTEQTKYTKHMAQEDVSACGANNSGN